MGRRLAIVAHPKYMWNSLHPARSILVGLATKKGIIVYDTSNPR